MPVLNCPKEKIFKLSQYYLSNKINNDKTINIFNNVCQKNIKSNNYNNKKEKKKMKKKQ